MSNEELKRYVKEAKNKNSKAFEKIYKATYQEAYIIAYSLVDDKDSIEDIIHDVYIKVLLNLPNLKNDSSFRPWFKRIVTNTCKDFMIKKKPDLFSSYDLDNVFEEDFDQRLVDAQSLEKPFTSKAEAQEISKRILKAIEKLPDEQRICVMMHYFSEMKVDEIANTLGISRNTVLSRLSYARKKLKKELEDDKDNNFFGIVLFPYIQSIGLAPEAAALKASGETLAAIMASTEAKAFFAFSATGFFAKIAALTALQRIILIVSAVAIIGGISAFFINARTNGESAELNTKHTEATTRVSVEKTDNKKEALSYSYGNLLLSLNGYTYFSDNGSIFRTSGSIAKREKIADGNANNFVTDGKNIYFISDGSLNQYDADECKIIKSVKTESEYIAFSGEELYTVSVKNKIISRLDASLGEEKVKALDAGNLRFFGNTLSYYKGSDMYYADFSNGDFNGKMVIDGKELKGMKLASQILDGRVYYPDFNSDETGILNVGSTNGEPLYKIRLKRGYVDFGVCNNKIIYSATDGGTYSADLNGESDKRVSSGDYSITACSKPYALCYSSKNNTSVLFNAQNEEFITLSGGYVKEFEYSSGVVFYRLNGVNFVKEL